MKKLPIPKLTDEGKAAVSAIKTTLQVASAIGLVVFLYSLTSCQPITEVEPPKITMEFETTCSDAKVQTSIDSLLVYKLQVLPSSSDTIRHKYQGHFGNVPSGISFSALSGLYEIRATLGTQYQTRLVRWTNVRDTSLVFSFPNQNCRGRKEGSR